MAQYREVKVLGGVVKFAPRECRCLPPNVGAIFDGCEIRIGDRFQCAHCSSVWEVVDDQREGTFWRRT